MKYAASFSCKIGNYTIQWRELFTFRQDAIDAVEIEHGWLKSDFGEENIKKFRRTVRKVKN